MYGARIHQGRGGIPQGPHPFYSMLPFRHTDKKENQIFLIYQEIQRGAKS
jgi:hypothetical protein